MKLHMKLLVATACLVAPMAVMAATPNTCMAHGEAAFHALTQGQYSKVGANFAPQLASQLKPATLKKMWQKDIQGRAGKFQKLGKFQSRKVEGHEVQFAPMDFAKAHLAAVFACDSKARLTTFAVVNPAVAGTGSSH